MLNTHVTALNHTLTETHEWLEELVQKGSFEVEQQAYSHLRAVLHTLRDRLTVEEAAHFASQLPMLVRGFYFEGWRPALAPNDWSTVEEFYGRIRDSLRPAPGEEVRDLEGATRAVLALLTEKLTEGQIRHVREQLPKEVQQLWPA
ncbi:MAG TPA: DUF2267 domain-containing protein [Longimicrobiales bacterium]|nr:DUF2267 domain-containing protein [Longimicrobiales bacterium]